MIVYVYAIHIYRYISMYEYIYIMRTIVPV